MSYERRPREMH